MANIHRTVWLLVLCTISLGSCDRATGVCGSSRDCPSGQRCDPQLHVCSATTDGMALAAPMMPPGSIIAFGGSNLPAGWLLCDGSAVSRAEFGALYETIGAGWGAGD